MKRRGHGRPQAQGFAPSRPLEMPSLPGTLQLTQSPSPASQLQLAHGDVEPGGRRTCQQQGSTVTPNVMNAAWQSHELLWQKPTQNILCWSKRGSLVGRCTAVQQSARVGHRSELQSCQKWVWRCQQRNFLGCCLAPEITRPVLMSS